VEGPSLVIQKEEAAKFVGNKTLAATGAALIDFERIAGQKLNELKTWGKHFLMVFDDCSIRIHYLMFGSYRIDNPREDRVPKLSLQFPNGQWDHYTCAVKFIDTTDLDSLYDWTADLMNDNWDPKAARKKLKAKPDRLVCDVLLDQDIFSGLGNIMKNETLFRTRIHPESRVGSLPPAKLTKLISESRNYAFDFLRWKKIFVLRKHWEAHKKKTCANCGGPIILEYTGILKRRSFYCERCQIKYA
jgi:endonuclease-8